ncbi:EI24 domain-containing protein [Roseospirillum parvum]|uniref:Uncharacterized protein involved in cysteine biosynthesis n=1 Tax=Roseospirillum parvum TaxID=83401 RepID=A0A1G7WRP8_9PROT|nr:EI24 domain-containing protein [Roseospirillum parvum]SDG74655.1 Uncharacterized protein involved in cysteine biosynthesis [Roseospirillum parvum]
MIDAFSKAVGQLSDPRIRQVLWLSMGGALAVYVLLAIGLWLILGSFTLTDTAWLEAVIDWVSGLGVLILALLLFPGVVSLVLGFLLEDVAQAVEDRHYPEQPKARAQPLAEVLLSTVRFVGVMVFLNLIALPVYLILPPIAPFVFFGLNGYLLSREYFELVALRRLDAKAVDAMRKASLKRLWPAGAVLAVLLTVPVVNLVAPILGTAAMVHLFQTLNRRPA